MFFLHSKRRRCLLHFEFFGFSLPLPVSCGLLFSAKKLARFDFWVIQIDFSVSNFSCSIQFAQQHVDRALTVFCFVCWFLYTKDKGREREPIIGMEEIVSKSLR